jgi:large subunit ribosomal protein L11
MAKKIVGFIKLQVPAGKANPRPHRPGAGSARPEHHGVLQGLQRADAGVEPGLKLPVVITAYADKSFTFIMKTPPATVLIKKAPRSTRARASRTSRRWARSPARSSKRSPRPR